MRLDPGFDFIDPKFFCDRARGPLVVAGEHDDLQTELVQMLNGGRRRFLDRIGHTENACRAVVDRDENHCLSLLLQFFRAPFQFVQTAHALCAKEFGSAREDTPTVEAGDNAAARRRLKFAHNPGIYSALFRAIHNRARERMFAVLFHRCGNGEQFRF